ncbi:hypothetical protein KSS87_020171, partial [Heliosperma pusillum]
MRNEIVPTTVQIDIGLVPQGHTTLLKVVYSTIRSWNSYGMLKINIKKKMIW